jgi:hypothetical protein
VVDGEWEWDEGYIYEDDMDMDMACGDASDASAATGATATTTSLPAPGLSLITEADENKDASLSLSPPDSPSNLALLATTTPAPCALPADPLSTTRGGKYLVTLLPDGRVTVPATLVLHARRHLRLQQQRYARGAHAAAVDNAAALSPHSPLSPSRSQSTSTRVPAAPAASSASYDPSSPDAQARNLALASFDHSASVFADNGYFESLRCVCVWALAALDADGMRAYLDQTAFFDEIVAVSGHLVTLPKGPERTRALHAALRQIRVRPGVYLPTNPDHTIVAMHPDSGRTLQSAAKVPILVAFDVVHRTQQQMDTFSPIASSAPPPAASLIRTALIFKSHDDIRQDALALQVTALCQAAYNSAGTPLAVCPYRVLPTSMHGVPGGVIECVANAASRDEIGKKTPGSLQEHFQKQFGKPTGRKYLTAQRQFLLSLAGYAVASYILQVKDRHNGNIMVTNTGALVHIDFGFIFDISPGGDMRFENAAFKLTQEMADVIGSTRSSPLFQWFTQCVLQGFLAVRARWQTVLAVTAPMLTSTLHCFKGGYKGTASPSLLRLRDRLGGDLDAYSGAKRMHSLLEHANANWRTNTYDWIQLKQQNIYYWRGDKKAKKAKDGIDQLYDY